MTPSIEIYELQVKKDYDDISIYLLLASEGLTPESKNYIWFIHFEGTTPKHEAINIDNMYLSNKLKEYCNDDNFMKYSWASYALNSYALAVLYNKYDIYHNGEFQTSSVTRIYNRMNMTDKRRIAKHMEDNEIPKELIDHYKIIEGIPLLPYA